MALLAGAATGHVELAGVKQWWGTDISEISLDVSWVKRMCAKRNSLHKPVPAVWHLGHPRTMLHLTNSSSQCS